MKVGEVYKYIGNDEGTQGLMGAGNLCEITCIHSKKYVGIVTGRCCKAYSLRAIGVDTFGIFTYEDELEKYFVKVGTTLMETE